MDKNNETKKYLGDGVYVDYSEFGEIILWTENGIDITNKIILEPEVYAQFVKWVSARGL